MNHIRFLCVCMCQNRNSIKCTTSPLYQRCVVIFMKPHPSLFILNVCAINFSPEITLLVQLFFLFPSQLELKPQGRLLMEARYYLEKCGEWLKLNLLLISVITTTIYCNTQVFLLPTNNFSNMTKV